MIEKIQINKVDNGYYIRLENKLGISKVFIRFKDLIQFLCECWGDKDEPEVYDHYGT